jgi:zinc protease
MIIAVTCPTALVAVLLLSTPTLAASGGGPAASPASTANPFPYPIEVRSFANGLQLVMVPSGPSGLIAYFTVVRVGSRNEVEEGHTGFAHFFEHMMFRGTPSYPSERYSETLRSAGVNDNAFTTDDFTVYFNTGPSDALPTVVALEADRIRHLAYSKEAFQTEAKAVLGEYNKDVADPGFALDEELHKAAFRKSTYRHTTMGFLEDIERMPEQYDYSLKFLQRWYVPGNTTLVVAGDFKPEEVAALIEKDYGGWKGKLATIKIPKEPEQRRKVTLTRQWKTSTLPRVVIGFHAPSIGTDLKAAAVQNLLGPLLLGMASALYNDLVLERHLAVSLDSWYGDHRDPSLFALEVTAKNEAALPEIQQALDRSLADLAAKGPDAKLLADVKSNQRYGLLMGLETPFAIGMAVAATLGPTGNPDQINALYRAIAEVSAADIAAFAKKYLTPANETVVVLRPPVTQAAVPKGHP